MTCNREVPVSVFGMCFCNAVGVAWLFGRWRTEMRGERRRAYVDALPWFTRLMGRFSAHVMVRE
jgi:hypothetical protein